MPTLEVLVTPDILLPPNHKYLTMIPTIAASDNCDPNAVVTLVSMESDEPHDDVDNGETPNDIVINPDNTFSLWAERSSASDGRICTITYQPTNACGNSTLATTAGKVPHGRKK